MPCGYRKEYIPCWNEDSDRLYEELEDTENPETAKELLRSLDDARRSKWTQTVASLNFTMSSKQAWSLIRRLGGASKLATSRSQVKPDLVAQRIVSSSKVPADKVFTRDVTKKYRRLRRRTRIDREISKPFTVKEVDTALSQLKSGKAADHGWPDSSRTYCREISYHPGKPPELPESYRPVALLSVTYKFVEIMIRNRI